MDVPRGSSGLDQAIGWQAQLRGLHQVFARCDRPWRRPTPMIDSRWYSLSGEYFSPSIATLSSSAIFGVMYKESLPLPFLKHFERERCRCQNGERGGGLHDDGGGESCAPFNGNQVPPSTYRFICRLYIDSPILPSTSSLSLSPRFFICDRIRA